MSSRPATAAAAVLLGVLAALVGALILRTGVTYDESAYAAMGPIFLTGRPGALAREYPPLPSYARGLALLPLKPSLPRPVAGREKEALNPNDYGQLFLFRNRAAPAALLRAARLPSLALALLLALLIWSWGKSLGGPGAAGAALLLLVFEPNLLAHGSLATTDLFVAAFSCAAIWAWAGYLKGEKASAAWAAGAAAGAAIASKATGLILLPAFAFSLAWCGKRRFGGLFRAAAAAGGVTAALYAPIGLSGFTEMLAFRSGEMGRVSPSYFFGAAYDSAHAFYIPGMLLVKTTIPLLVLSFWGALKLRKDHPEDFRAASAALAALLFAALLRRTPFGIRHFLMFYPLLCLAAGTAAAYLWKSRPGLVTGLLAFHVFSSMAAFPFPLAYFNELAGGPRNGRNILGDSNLDWGQSLPELRNFVQKNPGGLILSYYGKDCPREYGLDFQEAFSTPGLCPGSSDGLLPGVIDKEWLAVSATKWQGFYESGPPAWGWLRSRKPFKVLGYSILIYDVTKDSAAHLELSRMYVRAGRPQAAARELVRSQTISSN